MLEGGEIAGIVTERDYARKIALQGRSSASTRVDEVMTRKVHCVLPRQTSEECMSLMTSNRMRHLPVISETRELQGLISIGDIVKDLKIRDKVFLSTKVYQHIREPAQRESMAASLALLQMAKVIKIPTKIK